MGALDAQAGDEVSGYSLHRPCVRMGKVDSGARFIFWSVTLVMPF